MPSNAFARREIGNGWRAGVWLWAVALAPACLPTCSTSFVGRTNHYNRYVPHAFLWPPPTSATTPARPGAAESHLQATSQLRHTKPLVAQAASAVTTGVRRLRAGLLVGQLATVAVQVGTGGGNAADASLVQTFVVLENTLFNCKCDARAAASYAILTGTWVYPTRCSTCRLAGPRTMC